MSDKASEIGAAISSDLAHAVVRSMAFNMLASLYPPVAILLSATGIAASMYSCGTFSFSLTPL